MEIKIFTGGDYSLLEKEVNKFISDNKIYVDGIKATETDGSEGYGMTIVVIYESPERHLYNLGDIQNAARDLLLEEFKEIYEEDELMYELAEKYYGILKEKYNKLIESK